MANHARLNLTPTLRITITMTTHTAVEYHTAKHIAIDLSIVYPYDDKAPGTKSAEQAQAKWKAHHRAIEAAEHIFVPFIMETTAYLDQQAFTLIRALSS